jgi:hypothetical protein
MKMMNIKQWLLASASLLLLSACSDDSASKNKTAEDGRIPIMLGSCIDDGTTRSGSNIQNNKFKQGAIIDVQIEPTDIYATTHYDLLQYQVSNSTGGLTPVKKVYPYYPVEGGTVDIYAVYPVGKLDAESFTVKTEQLNDQNYKDSDLMFAKVSNQSATQNTVTLPFRHLLSKIIVKLTEGDNGEDVENSKVSLLNVATKINLTARGVLGTVDESSRTTIKMSNDGSVSSAAIIVPQEVPSGVLIEVKLANNDIVNYKMPQNMIFESGKKYTYNIKVVEETLMVNYDIEPWIETDDFEQNIKL